MGDRPPAGREEEKRRDGGQRGGRRWTESVCLDTRGTQRQREERLISHQSGRGGVCLWRGWVGCPSIMLSSSGGSRPLRRHTTERQAHSEEPSNVGSAGPESNDDRQPCGREPGSYVVLTGLCQVQIRLAAICRTEWNDYTRRSDLSVGAYGLMSKSYDVVSFPLSLGLIKLRRLDWTRLWGTGGRPLPRVPRPSAVLAASACGLYPTRVMGWMVHGKGLEGGNRGLVNHRGFGWPRVACPVQHQGSSSTAMQAC